LGDQGRDKPVPELNFKGLSGVDLSDDRVSFTGSVFPLRLMLLASAECHYSCHSVLLVTTSEFLLKLMTHFLADDGERIYLQVSGEGRALILLHGWTSSRQEWLPFVDQLSVHHRVFRYDARGHGGHHPTNQTEPTVQRMAQDLRNLIERFDLRETVVVGHSMGALTLWQYINDYGCDRLSKVCFIDQSPKLLTDDQWPHGIYGDFNDRQAASFLQALKSDFAESVLTLSAYGLNKRAREKYKENAQGFEKIRSILEKLDPLPLIRCWQSLTEADYRETLARIAIPTLLIYGGESNYYHSTTAHYVHRQIAGAILRIYENTDHSPHQWQRERFSSDLLEFMSTP
jgi:pimeloyl-ACP methyl ester carboxylesterase